MTINLHIERLMLEGVAIDRHEGVLLQQAAQTEFARLLTRHGIGESWQEGGAVSQLAAPMLNLGESENALSFGQAIGQSVYRSIGTQVKQGGTR
jgi:hypothetical protein